MERNSSTAVVEDKKMKGKLLEEPSMEPESDSWLDLRLFNGEVGETSRKQVNVLDLFGPDDSPKASQDSSDEDAKKLAEMKQYPCKFCDRKFSISQALGGHQNAHKKERSDMKREQATEANPFGTIYPFRAVAAGMAGFPRHAGLYNNKNDQNNNLGINMQSMIQKPSYHHYPNSFHTGSRSHNSRDGWPWQDNMNSQPNYMRENYSFASALRSYPTLDNLLGLRSLSVGASNRGRPLLSELINFVPTGAVARVDFIGAGAPGRNQQSDRPTQHDLCLRL